MATKNSRAFPISKTMSALKKYRESISGQVTLSVALCAPTMLLAAGGSIEYYSFAQKRDVAQQVVDSAALGAAQTLIENSGLEQLKKEQKAQLFIADTLKFAGIPASPAPKTTFDQVTNAVSLDLDVEFETAFLKLAGITELNAVVRAIAAAEPGEEPVCILALDSTATTGIKFSGNGAMKAKDCVVWSNASGAESITFDGSGKVSASKICAVGRASSGSVFKVEPSPDNYCRKVSDPLANWTPPSSGGCNYNSKDWIDRTTAQLEPGVYCGGLRVNAKNIFMSPGVYIIRDGALILRGESKISGKGVGIYLEGEDATLDIDGKSKVDLTSTDKGPMAGIVIASSKVSDEQESTVTGRSDLKIGGVIYLPNHHLNYWGESDTKAASPVTTIIAKTIDIGGDAYLEVKNNKAKAKYAPVVSTGNGMVRLLE
jgi:hypothetical protein